MFSYIRLSKNLNRKGAKARKPSSPSPSGEGLGGGAIVNNYQKIIDFHL